MKYYNIEKLVEKYSDMVLRIAYQNCLDKSDSEDIVQEVFIRLIKNIKKINNEQYLKAWLIRVTINVSKDYSKKAWYKKTEEIKENQLDCELNKEETELLEEIYKLKPVYRNIIYLYYYEGYKIKEISQILKMKENTVGSNLRRAREQLKYVLDEGGEIDEL